MSSVINRTKKAVQDIGSGLGFTQGTTVKGQMDDQAKATATLLATQQDAQRVAKAQQDAIVAEQAKQQGLIDEQAALTADGEVRRAAVKARGGRKGILNFSETTNGMSSVLGGGQA